MVLLFAITLFISAAMLFVAELMFARLVLPLLGGTPAVWNTCMVFFQAALLAGYGYAHLATSRLKIKRQITLHMALMFLPVLIMVLMALKGGKGVWPIAIPQGWTPPTSQNPVASILLLMLLTVGVPFTIVSTSAPLIQRWFAHTGHKSGRDPYFLYAASNAGSFAGLIGYLVFLEPNFRRTQQSYIWAYAYAGLAILTGVCALTVLAALKVKGESTANGISDSAPSKTLPTERPITALRQIRWLLLAFAPSSLLLGFTTYITTDITSVPLLWVVPLSLYLLTFVIAFSGRKLIPQKVLVLALPVFVLTLTIVLPRLDDSVPTMLSLGLHMLTFFIAAMACHGELADDRPPAEHLTKFYLIISSGGALGGLFNSLIAPLIFRTVVEYPAAMVLACITCLYQRTSSRNADTHVLWRKSSLAIMDGMYITIVAAVAALGVFAIREVELIHNRFHSINENYFTVVVLVIISIACYSLVKRPLRFGIGLALILAIMAVGLGNKVGTICEARSFFGVVRVYQDHESLEGNRDCPTHFFVHGTTFHGVQYMLPEYRDIPITYFYETGPIGQVMTAYNGGGHLHDIGITGLGAGTLACYTGKGQALTFYEIDPLVERVAEDPKCFTFLSDARARGVKLNVVLGDARLTIAKVPEKSYDIIIFDAFSSDSIPIHLLTKQALALFMTKLRDHGIIAIQITNRYMNLEPIIGNVTQSLGLKALYQHDDPSDEEFSRGKWPSEWVLVARNTQDFQPLSYHKDWQKKWKPIKTDQTKKVWTDDYSNILQAMAWHK